MKMKTYQKLAALLLAAALLFALTACGKKDVSGAVTAAPETAETPAEAPAEEPAEAPAEEPVEAPAEEPAESELQIGGVNGGVYQNAYFGFACELDDNWLYYSEEQILEVNQATAEVLEGSGLEAYLDNASSFTDMFAQKADGSVINVNIENLGYVYGATLSEEDYVEISADKLVDALEAQGMENITTTAGSVNFAGGTHAALRVRMEYQGISAYELIVCKKVGSYMGCVAICTWQTDETDALAGCFYAA